MADLDLATARLVLRPPAAGDLAWIAEAMNTPAVLRHLGGPRSAQDVAEGLDADIAAFASGRYRRWTIWLRGEDHRIGRCGMFQVRSEAAPAALRGRDEIGWTLAQGAWGCGYATEAARAVLDFAFGPLGLARVWAQTSASNGPSTRLIGRLGFVRQAELDYIDPDYPAQDNPTTVWSRDAVAIAGG